MSQDPVFGLSQRLPPSNLQAEQALLGAILANNRALERCPGLEPEHFADPVHGRLFQVCQKIVQAGGVADGVTLKNRLEHSGILDEVGGTAYLAQLLSAMVGIINAGEYAAAVREAWVRRQVIDISAQAINGAFGTDPDLDPATIVTDAVDQMMKVSEVADPQTAGTWADSVDAAVDGSEEAAHAGEAHLRAWVMPILVQAAVATGKTRTDDEVETWLAALQLGVGHLEVGAFTLETQRQALNSIKFFPFVADIYDIVAGPAVKIRVTLDALKRIIRSPTTPGAA